MSTVTVKPMVETPVIDVASLQIASSLDRMLARLAEATTKSEALSIQNRTMGMLEGFHDVLPILSTETFLDMCERVADVYNTTHYRLSSTPAK